MLYFRMVPLCLFLVLFGPSYSFGADNILDPNGRHAASSAMDSFEDIDGFNESLNLSYGKKRNNPRVSWYGYASVFNGRGGPKISMPVTFVPVPGYNGYLHFPAHEIFGRKISPSQWKFVSSGDPLLPNLRRDLSQYENRDSIPIDVTAIYDTDDRVLSLLQHSVTDGRLYLRGVDGPGPFLTFDSLVSEVRNARRPDNRINQSVLVEIEEFSLQIGELPISTSYSHYSVGVRIDGIEDQDPFRVRTGISGVLSMLENGIDTGTWPTLAAEIRDWPDDGPERLQLSLAIHGEKGAGAALGRTGYPLSVKTRMLFERTDEGIVLSEDVLFDLPWPRTDVSIGTIRTRTRSLNVRLDEEARWASLSPSIQPAVEGFGLASLFPVAADAFSVIVELTRSNGKAVLLKVHVDPDAVGAQPALKMTMSIEGQEWATLGAQIPGRSNDVRILQYNVASIVDRLAPYALEGEHLYGRPADLLEVIIAANGDSSVNGISFPGELIDAELKRLWDLSCCGDRNDG